MGVEDAQEGTSGTTISEDVNGLDREKKDVYTQSEQSWWPATLHSPEISSLSGERS